MPLITKSWRAAALMTTATLLAACGGGASDVAGAGPQVGGSETTLTLVAYAVPEPGWSEIIPAFIATQDGEGVTVRASYGPSGEQSRSLDGKPADLVNFSVEPDITRLVDAGKVAEDWNADVTRGIPVGSVVTLVVREGNPKNVRDWDDLLQPGLEVVSPSPMSSGSAKWNLLGPYAAKSNGGRNSRAGLDFVDRLVGDHIATRPTSGREATDLFVQGTGDVLLSYENEAIDIKRQGKPVEHIVPPQTIKIENPVAVVKSSQHLGQANALKNFLYTPEGQTIWARAGFRPVDPGIAAQFAADFPAPAKLWTIADLGGWSAVEPALFDEHYGAITKIYQRATR